MEKPTTKHVTFYRNEGNYNFLNPSEKSAQYVFVFPQLSREEVKEMDLKVSYLIDFEKDYGYEPDHYTALEAAIEIQDVYDGYFIHTGKSDIDKMVEYLESIEDDQAELRHEYEIENAKYQISYWEKELEKLET